MTRTLDVELWRGKNFIMIQLGISEYQYFQVECSLDHRRVWLTFVPRQPGEPKITERRPSEY